MRTNVGAAAAALWMVSATAAWAGQLQVSPVRLYLGPGERTTVVTVRNFGTTALRAQVTAVVWAQDGARELTAEPAEDVSYFPSLLTIEPGQSRIVRVGVSAQPSATERTYRLLIEELPEPQASSAEAVRVLTRMSLPVFFAPADADFSARLDAVRVEGRELAFELENAGRAHLFAKSARVRGLDAAGGSVFENEQAGWYVLAGRRRRFVVQLPEGACPKVHRFVIEATVGRKDEGRSVTAEVPGCRR